MNFSKVRLIINNSRHFTFLTQNSMESSLGRWQLKNVDQIEYYMTKMHADPGYQFLHTIERNKEFEEELKKIELNKIELKKIELKSTFF